MHNVYESCYQFHNERIPNQLVKERKNTFLNSVVVRQQEELLLNHAVILVESKTSTRVKIIVLSYNFISILLTNNNAGLFWFKIVAHTASAVKLRHFVVQNLNYINDFKRIFFFIKGINKKNHMNF